METIKFLTSSEKRELYRNIDQDTGRLAVRNQAIFYLAKYCALRASEMRLLRLDEFDSQQNKIFCHRLKRGRGTMLKIVDKTVLEALKRHLLLHDPEQNILFPSQEQTPISRQSLDCLMKRYCEGTSIPLEKRHFHVLRHTRAIELLEATGNVYDVQYWLGHRNIQNTMIYLQYTTKQHEQLYRLLEIHNQEQED